MQQYPASQGFVCWCGLQNCPYHPPGPAQLPPLGAAPYDPRRDPEGYGPNGYNPPGPYQAPPQMAGYFPGLYGMPPPGYAPPGYGAMPYYPAPGYGPPPYPAGSNADPRYGGLQPPDPYGGAPEGDPPRQRGDARQLEKRRAAKAPGPGPSRRAGREDLALAEEQQRLLAQELAKPRWKEPKPNDADAAWNTKVQEWKDQQRRDVMERREAKELEQRWERQQAEIARLVGEIERATNEGRRVRERKVPDAGKGKGGPRAKPLPRHLPPLDPGGPPEASQSLPATPTPVGRVDRGRPWADLPNSAPVHRSPYDGFAPAALPGFAGGFGYPPAPYPAFGAPAPGPMPALPREHPLHSQRAGPPYGPGSPAAGPQPAVYVEHPQPPYQAPVIWHVPPPQRNAPTPRAAPGPSASAQPTAAVPVNVPHSPHSHPHSPRSLPQSHSWDGSAASPTSSSPPALYSDHGSAADFRSPPQHSAPPVLSPPHPHVQPQLSAQPQPQPGPARLHYGVAPPPALQPPPALEWDRQGSSASPTPQTSHTDHSAPTSAKTPVQPLPARPPPSPVLRSTAGAEGPDLPPVPPPDPQPSPRQTVLSALEAEKEAQRQEEARHSQRQLLAEEEEERRYLVTDERVARSVIATARSRVALHIMQAPKGAAQPSGAAASVPSPQAAEEAPPPEDERQRDRQRALQELREREVRALARLKELSSGMI
eukprot:EG_transcript_3525